MKRSCLLFVTLGLFQLQGGTVSFFDGTFNLADYSAPVIYNPQGITITNTQILSGGNPNAAISTALEFPNDFIMGLALIRPSFSYNPSTQGAIVSIDASVDRYLDSNGQVTGAPLGGSWVLLQGGNYYRVTSPGVPLPDPPAFQTHSVTGSHQSDWTLFDFTTGTIDPTSHPDFSSSGSPIQFGYTFRLQSTSGLRGLWELRGDNLSYTINAVPEPGTLPLMLLSGILGLALKRTLSSHS